MGPSVLEAPSGWQSGIERVLEWLSYPSSAQLHGPRWGAGRGVPGW